MPDWTYTFTPSGNFVDEDNFYGTYIPSQNPYSQQMWEEHQQMIDQQEKQAEELRVDKVNYPLFFWKDKK